MHCLYLEGEGTSPSVFFYGGHWVMFYDASANGAPADSGHSCISVATLVCTATVLVHLRRPRVVIDVESRLVQTLYLNMWRSTGPGSAVTSPPSGARERGLKERAC